MYHQFCACFHCANGTVGTAPVRLLSVSRLGSAQNTAWAAAVNMWTGSLLVSIMDNMDEII
jgi:hypothetical protein